VAVKDVADADSEIWDAVARRRGYGRVPGLPVAWLNIDVDSVDSYLARLSPGTRRDMRRKLRAFASVRVELRSELGSELARAMALYQQTRNRAQMQFETLTPAYFTAVAARMGPRAFYVLYYREDELLAMNLLLQGSNTLLDKFFCMDAETGRSLNLYFLSWFTNLRLCMERGLKRYQSGQAGYGNKLRLGSKLTRTSMYFRHRNAIVNGVLRLVSPWFAADTALPRESS
jgi:uncharacterized protein